MNNWCVVILFLSLFNISFSQTPPGINPNNEFLKMGYLDVSLYGADLTGIEDATLAIQEAVRVARQYQLACYFPSGIYLVSDTINCFLDVVPTPTDPHFNYFSDRRKPVYLVGATKPRPLIKLSDHAVGFDDPLHPKAIFWLWAKNRQTGSIDPNDEQSNIAFNMVIKGFDIDISGHAGAVGIRFAGAQGSTIEDIKIQADGAYAGFHGCVGQGGGTYNIEVHGGRHAFVLDNGNQSKHPVIVGAKFYNQTQEVFKLDPLWTPMTLVGFHIKKSQGNIMLGSPTRAGLSMIDGLIEYTGTSHSNSLFSTVTRGLYLGNIYVKNYNELFNDTPLNMNEWNWIKEYNYCGTNSKNLIDGVLNNSTNANIEILSNAPSGKSLIEKHIWNDAEFISIENRNDIDFVNVLDSIKMQGSPALGNGVNDDTDRLQWALDNFKKVFLPKGIYIVSKSLTLHSDNQFFGAGKTFSVIRAGNNWNYTNGASMIKTDDNKISTASISFLMLETNPTKHHDLTRIKWHLGSQSIIRDIMVGLSTWSGNLMKMNAHAMYHFSGSAGGKIYALTGEYTKNKGLTHHPDYRHILVEGTDEPLRFYGCNVERAESDIQMEIKDAKNIEIYFLKVESGLAAGGGEVSAPSIPLSISNVENLQLHGSTGLAGMIDGKGVIELKENSENIVITSVKPFHDSTQINSHPSFANIKEFYGGEVFRISNIDHVALFKRTKLIDAIEEINDSDRQSNFKVYPSPTKDYLNISTKQTGQYVVQLFDNKGRMMIRGLLLSSTLKINVSEMKAGCYFLLINTLNGNNVMNKKLIILP